MGGKFQRGLFSRQGLSVAKLLGVGMVHALDARRPGLGSGPRRQEHPRQNGDVGVDPEQLNQSESGAGGREAQLHGNYDGQEPRKPRKPCPALRLHREPGDSNGG